jgi:hypothetical protein
MKKRTPVWLLLSLYGVFLILVGAFLINVLGVTSGGVYSGLGAGFSFYAVSLIRGRRSSQREARQPGQK